MQTEKQTKPLWQGLCQNCNHAVLGNLKGYQDYNGNSIQATTEFFGMSDQSILYYGQVDGNAGAETTVWHIQVFFLPLLYHTDKKDTQKKNRTTTTKH